MIASNMMFMQSQLTEAAYADLWDSETGAPISNPEAVKQRLINLQADGSYDFSNTQATDFVAHWEVVHHLPNTDSGFSATLFRRIDDDPESGFKSGDLVFALRGTEQVGLDLLQADFNELVKNGLAFRQIIDMYNYWQRLITPAGELARQAKLVLSNPLTTPSDKLIWEGNLPPVPWTIELEYSSIGLGEVDLADNLVAATGHSLGGHLATAFTRLFPGWTTEAVTFNGAGYPTGAIPGLSLTAANNIPNLFSMLDGNAAFPSGSISNFYGDKNVEIVTMNSFFGLLQPGDHQPMFIEQDTVYASVFGHGMGQMADSAAVFDLLLRLDGSLASATTASITTKLNPLFEAASPTRNKSLEEIVNALADLFNTGVKIADTETDQREALYLAIDTIKKNSNHQLAIQAKDFITVQPLAGLSRNQIVAKAQLDSAEGLAYRYAIANLIPFAISGDAALYSQHNASGELDLYDPATGEGALTERYLRDRAAMLAWQMQFNTDDLQPEGNTFYKFQGGTPYYFRDMSTDARISIGGGYRLDMLQPLTEFSHVVFGSGNDDTIFGQGKNDWLYGGDGADILTGKGGSDYLEGGQGDDTYVFNPNDGFDTVLDNDGQGVIKFGDIEAKGSAGLDPAKWLHTDGADTWTDTKNNITYSKTLVDGETQLLIHHGDSTVRVRGWIDGELGIELGDGALPVPSAPTLAGGDADEYISDDIYVRGANANTSSAVNGTGQHPGYTGLASDDVIAGGGGRDVVDAGAGNDTVYGDVAVADLAAYIESSASAPGTGQLGDWLQGGAGDDTVVGGASDDQLLGGHGSDLLIGGAGDDLITADEVYGTQSFEWTRQLVSGTWLITPTYDIDPYPSQANSGNDVVYAGAGNDHAWGWRGNDILMGENGNDRLMGEGGDDVVMGGYLAGDAAWMVRSLEWRLAA